MVCLLPIPTRKFKETGNANCTIRITRADFSVGNCFGGCLGGRRGDSVGLVDEKNSRRRATPK
jgi:hypothetical protein